MDIIGIVTEMQAHKGTPEEKRVFFADKYPDFADKYPGLFFKSSEPGMDMKMLEFMVGQLARSDGEEKVGQELFDKYVSPAFINRFKK